MTDFTSVDDTRFGLKSAQRKAQLPWPLVARSVARTLRQVCGVRASGLRMLESTLKDVPMREGEEFPSLPCVAFSAGGICSVSQSFLDLAGESVEKVLGADLKRAPLHWVLPNETNKWLNLEALVPLEKLHKSAFAGARLRQQTRTQATEEAPDEEEAVTSQSFALEERAPVTVSLLLSPGREGKVFWNLVHAFRTEIKKELLVIHVLMPIAVDVPSFFWQLQTLEGTTTQTNGPIPQLTAYVDGILQRLRSKLGKLQKEEAKQVAGVEEHFHSEETVPLPPSPARRRASDLGPMGQTPPNLSTELLRVAMTRRISEVSLCSTLPELNELWDAHSESRTRCRVVEAVELRCRDLARALTDCFSGIHFVPRFGSAMALPYELYYFWEEVLANESQVLMSHWKYGKKGDRSHRRELFNIEPYMILDPDEIDCPIAYMSQGFEDLFGYWRAWALGRNFRFLLLPDALPNRVFNGPEVKLIEDFCSNQGAKEQGSPEASSRMMSLLRLYSVKSKQAIWCCLYLRHVWLQDPTVFENQFDFSAKHFILAVVLPLYTQMPALKDLLNSEMSETNMQLTARLRQMLLERTQNVEFWEKEANNILNSVIPAWLLECGRGVPSCMVGQHFVPRLGLAPLKEFQGLWPHLVRLLFRLKTLPEEMMKSTLTDQEHGLACWVADLRSKDLPLVFLSQSLQKLSGFDADFALARNVQLFQPKNQRIDQAINSEESTRLEEFSTQNRAHGDVMASLLLLEARNGRRFFAVQQTFYLKEPRSDRSYLLSVLFGIDMAMPAVLKSHQITELSEDEMGMALDEWGVFLSEAREDVVGKPLMLSDVPKACEHYASRFAAFLRTCEDYVGDLFVPKIGLVEVHAFKGVLEHLVRKLRADLRRVLADDRAEERLNEIIMTVADPSGEDDPLVWISPGFEEYTGFQHEWALGRNCRFLQPKDFKRNQHFNGDQLHKLRKFCREGRKSSPPTVPTTLALLLNERRNGSPFWNLSSFIYVEVHEKRYIVSVMLPFREERVRFAELLSDDPEALEQQKRLKGLLSRHEGGAKFVSLEAVQRQLLSVFFADFPMLLQAPSVRAQKGLEIPIFGLEVGANNTQAMAGALKAGLRHVHILLPSGPTTRASDGSTFVRKILPLKLAEVLNNLQQQHLHYLREAMVITVRTPPHLVFVLAEVRKTLATAGYAVACWFLDVRGCTPADVADHWQAISQAKAPTEAVGIFGGNQRLLQAIHGTNGAFVAICAVKVHPGKRPDEPEMRLMSKLACNGTLPMAYGIFGPQNSWLQSSQAQSVAGRLRMAPSTLALKWAEHKGFLALVPESQDLFESKVNVEPRSFMRMYRAAPSVETCTSVLWGTTLGVDEVLNTPPTRLVDAGARSPKPCRSKEFQQLVPGLRCSDKAVASEAKPIKQQVLPDLLKRAQQGRAGLVWQGEAASKRLCPDASPRSAQQPLSPRDASRNEDMLLEADYDLPWPSDMQDLQELQSASIPGALKPLPPKRPKPPLRRKKPREVLIVSMAEGPVVEPDETASSYKSLFVSLGMK